jgi:hypothetical protein
VRAKAAIPLRARVALTARSRSSLLALAALRKRVLAESDQRLGNGSGKTIAKVQGGAAGWGRHSLRQPGLAHTFD